MKRAAASLLTGALLVTVAGAPVMAQDKDVIILK